MCVVSDFYAIKNENERVGRGTTTDHRDIAAFNEFILQANLFELPLICRFYTWYRKDGSCKSKLDRMLMTKLLFEKWWPNILRSLPIFIESSIQDWGPKPFKFINCWISRLDFKAFIKIRSEDHKVLRWAGFRLKEKLKLLKMDLKAWNKTEFGNIDNQIEEKKREIEILDQIDEALGLDEDEIIRRNQLIAELTRDLIWRDGLMSQKAKTKWLTEGDVNSRFFHNWINRKSKYLGIEGILVNNIWIDTMDESPLSYLGVNVGINHRRATSWSTLTYKVRRRLNSWNGNHLSFGGRITLIQSVLSALLIYCLSFYRIPKITPRELISIQRKFLWGDVRIKEKLLGLGGEKFAKKIKWVWRILNNEDMLWVIVLKSKYGDKHFLWGRSGSSNRVRGRGGGSSISGWWKDICERYWGVEGDGLRENSLKERYPRLFRISTQQESKVNEVGKWDGDGWRWEFNWRMELRDRELEMLNNLLPCLNRNILYREEEDILKWSYSANGIYSTNATYKRFKKVEIQEECSLEDKACKSLWSNYEPKKVKAIVWKILKERLPTKLGLQKRGVSMAKYDIIYPLCREKEESISHVFFTCKIN
ncbi:hypothetical protein ACS0TY_010843 [Phlomoides rotata]